MVRQPNPSCRPLVCLSPVGPTHRKTPDPLHKSANNPPIMGKSAAKHQLDKNGINLTNSTIYVTQTCGFAHVNLSLKFHDSHRGVHMKHQRLLASIACVSTMGMFAIPAVASAATSASLTVNHAAYLIKGPKLGSGRITLEGAGARLTVEAGGDQYWWHVKDGQGRDGYITTSSRYITKPANLDVQLVHNAYLVNAPKLHAGQIALETAGTDLTIEPGGDQYWWHVRDAHGRDGYITTSSYWTRSTSSTNTTVTNTTTTASTNASAFQLPPDVTIDDSITPIAGIHATRQQKFNAILQVAKSKLGTLYEWGHNEDRGQYGFDCSNYTEYVYHHALGYKLSTSSRTQYTSVGTEVPTSNMQPGDLITFRDGAHTGIYIGNNEMIQCGGGIGKVGYLSVAPGSYWGNHISAVKRMY